MNKLIELRPWPMFILLFLLPFILMIVCAKALVFGPGVAISCNRIIYSLVAIFYFAWLYAACSKLASRLPKDVSIGKMSVGPILLVPVVHMLSVFISNMSDLTGIGFEWLMENGSWINVTFLITSVGSLISVLLCIFYMARLLKTVEEEKRVGVNSFIGDFFLIWFVPIGIFNIQARLNSIAALPDDDMDIFTQETRY